MFATLAKTGRAITGLAKSGLAKSGFAKFWPVQPRHVAPAPYPPGRPTYCNDNLPGLRCPKDRRRTLAPALACHWFNRGGRLECRWQAEPDGDAPSSGLGESGTTGRASGLPQARAGHRVSQNRLRTVLSGARWLKRCRAWLAPRRRRKRQSPEQEFRRERVD